MSEHARTSPAPGGDFPDWLSPMLVKELRQGMRTRVFVLTFILLQILMTLNVVIGLLSSANGIDPGLANGVFWMMVGLPVLLILPMSGMNALSGERAANTLELIFLTRLSAWRIVFGKWCAIMAQIALFICAVLPYAVLRYFMGGVNLSENLMELLLMFAGSAVLTAITVGVSPFQTRITRVLSVLAFVFMLQAAVPFLIFTLMEPSVVRGGSASVAGWQVAVAMLLFGAMSVVLMLQIAAGKIAPSAKNHSAIKRLIGVGFLAIAAIMVAIGSQPGPTILAALLCSVPALIGAVCEPVRTTHAVYGPFVRKGFPGRLAGRILYPGWPAGVPYAVALLLGFGALLAVNKLLDDDQAALVYVAGLGALLFPAAIVRLLFPRTGNPLGFFIGVFAVCVVFTILGSILDGIFHADIRLILCLFPPSALVEGVFSNLPSGSASGPALYLAGAGAGVSAAALLLRMLSEWRRIAAIERQIAASADEPVA